MFLFGIGFFLLKKKGFVYLGYFTLMVEVDYVAKWKLYGISYIRVVFGIKERNIVNERVDIGKKESDEGDREMNLSYIYSLCFCMVLAIWIGYAIKLVSTLAVYGCMLKK